VISNSSFIVHIDGEAGEVGPNWGSYWGSQVPEWIHGIPGGLHERLVWEPKGGTEWVPGCAMTLCKA